MPTADGQATGKASGPGPRLRRLAARHRRRSPLWAQRLAGLPRPRLVDGCLFFNEVDLLEIRLSELDGVVDTFVIVEADRTFAGREKPFFFERHRDRFRQWEHKIVYEKFRLPDRGVPMDEKARLRNERAQREHLGRTVASLPLHPDDVAVLGDVDEIWRAEAAATLLRTVQWRQLLVLVLHNHRGYVNSLSTEALNGVAWAGPAACRLDTLARLGANGVRSACGQPFPPAYRSLRWAYLQGAGWHFSSMGGPEAFWIKAQNFSHVVDPHRVIEVPSSALEIRVLTGPATREECASQQAVWLSHAGTRAFSPVSWSGTDVPEGLPSSLKAGKERYRRFFFFTRLDE